MKSPNGIRIALIGLVAAGAAVVLRPLLFADTSTRLTRQAAQALSRQEWSQARQFAEQALVHPEENTLAAAVAGIACARMHQYDASLAHLRNSRELADEECCMLRTAVLVELGRRYRRLGRLVDAEQCFREALAIDDRELEAHRQLQAILSFQGRCAEAGPHLLARVQAGDFRAGELCLLGIPERIYTSDVRLREQCQTHDPMDPLPWLGRARSLVADHRLDEAEQLTVAIVSRHPHLALARALHGHIYLDQKRMAEFVEWYRALPGGIRDAPEIWFVRGLWAQQTGQTSAAVRCLLETLADYPNHVKANYQLSQLFLRLGEADRAEFFSQRSVRLSTLDYLINDLRGEVDDGLMRKAVAALEELGRGWEAVAWCRLAEEFGNETDWAIKTAARLSRRVSREPDLILAASHPLRGICIDEYPLPEMELETDSHFSPSVAANVDIVRFEESAARTGVDFAYFNSMNPEIGLEHIFQTTGGGAAAFDFDLDFWPDLYFGNGKVLPESVEDINDPQDIHRDALFRNMGDGRFVAITEQAVLGDDGFSQGVSTGDYNSDGFPDVYVANVGRNRLYQNNGDGTFTDVSSLCNTEGNEWTMSAMIADIDGDGLSDIYAVNYLKMDQVFNRNCKKDGQPLTCAPTLFDAEQDRIYHNRGDGTFIDVTRDYGILHERGKGLGIIGLQVEGRAGLQLFVANDTTENLFFERVPQMDNNGAYAENAVLAGLAMSGSGNMQACMGVAAGDADADGRIDLFVTNFFADSNTMYLQKLPGMFTDATSNCGLAEPSYNMVGFGTQFLDADLDGNLDLLITNGHVDQTFATGEPDRMRAQFLRNIGRGVFQEQTAETLGGFFSELHFGRALTRLDWNRDGRDDACIVHLDAPIALLTNETETANESISVYVRGTVDSRDAIGTTLTLTCGARTYVRQLTAGDGYQSTNERKQIFGVPVGQTPTSLHVRWPDGTEMVVPDPAPGALMIVQGQDAWRLASPRE